eukprot:366548-Chlamydomonas_euryale.AAC.3
MAHPPRTAELIACVARFGAAAPAVRKGLRCKTHCTTVAVIAPRWRWPRTWHVLDSRATVVATGRMPEMLVVCGVGGW